MPTRGLRFWTSTRAMILFFPALSSITPTSNCRITPTTSRRRVSWNTRHGVRNFVIDPASVQVDRRARRVKTDNIDVGRLLRSLMAYLRGEPKVWSVVSDGPEQPFKDGSDLLLALPLGFPLAGRSF